MPGCRFITTIRAVAQNFCISVTNSKMVFSGGSLLLRGLVIPVALALSGRGAKVADIAVLVVAADDSVKPQTIEAIKIIKAVKLPIVVAINKIDKEGADPKKVRADLSQHDILAEEWGGDVPMVEISAKQNLNIDKLLDILLLVADVHADDIKANPKRAAAGTVIEAHVDKGEGPVATVLVQTGTLKINDPLVVNGEIYGKVRAMKDYKGESLFEAAPSCPARILGFKVAPQVGDILDVGSAESASLINIKEKRNIQSGAEKKTVSVTADPEEEEQKKRKEEEERRQQEQAGGDEPTGKQKGVLGQPRRKASTDRNPETKVSGSK
jgi:translation initiation factor IF-2